MNIRRFPLATAVAVLAAAVPLTVAFAQDVEWSYEGATGPAHWASLSPAFGACGDGSLQSPIDLGAAHRRSAPALRTTNPASPLALLHNGETVEVRPDRAQALDIGERHYSLAQFHFHSPAEHVVDGRRAPLELHFVHQAADGERAVLGVLARTGRANAAFEQLLDALPRSKGAETRIASPVAVARLLPTTRRAYRYSGSLTTPPCTEGIRWMVLKSPIEISRHQLARLRETVQGNARPVQPLNHRAVTLH